MTHQIARVVFPKACTKAVLLGALLSFSGLVLADPSENRFYPPDQTGPFGIGHTTLIITDTSRNVDGSAPATGAGRPLYVHLWYPTSIKTAQHILYTWNDPVYSQNPGSSVYPGLPDLPGLTFPGAPSLNPVTEGATLAPGRYPLLVASHGNETAATKVMPDTLEVLASHGYVIASVEHTGDDDAWYQAHFLKDFLALPIGDNPFLGAGFADLIAQRSKDVRFVIDAALQGRLDQKTGMPFSTHIAADNIGVLGHSLGGETSLATVTGIGIAGLLPDTRVKAAFMAAGTNYGLILNSTDYAAAKVPLLFFGNDTGIAYETFNQFTQSRPKYLVDVAGLSHHTIGYQSGWCPDIHNSLATVNPAVFPTVFINPASLNPLDVANYVFDATFYFSYTGARESGLYDYCDASVFNGISDAQLTVSVFGDPSIVAVKNELKGLMPLRPELSIAETTRVTNWYAVSFFNRILKHQDEYGRFLTDSTVNRRANPLVNFVANCETVKAHPIDLQPGDRISFVPVANSGYTVSVRSGTSLYDPGTTKLSVGGDGSRYLNYPGFSFPVPGLTDPISTLVVNEDGAITARTASDIGGLDDNGSPWYSRGNLLLGGRFAIAALMKNLDSLAPPKGTAAAGGGIFAYFDAAQRRIVVTYQGVTAIGTTQPNTLQVAIYDSGKIEMNIGALAQSGAAFAPSILGTIGIAGGRTKARDLRTARPIDFGELRNNAPMFVPFGTDGAIYDQYYLGISGSCRADDGTGGSD